MDGKTLETIENDEHLDAALSRVVECVNEIKDWPRHGEVQLVIKISEARITYWRDSPQGHHKCN